MPRVRVEMTQKLLHDNLHYDPDSGIFTWTKQRTGRAKVGMIAGCFDKEGYRVIGMFGSLWFAHRLAWLHVNGTWPAVHIDHINGDKADNRLCNLREAGREENGRNRKVSKNNKLGIKNVSCVGEKFLVQVRHGSDTFVALFDDVELADLVAQEARSKYHGKFARHQ